jgi:hypothetical protein
MPVPVMSSCIDEFKILFMGQLADENINLVRRANNLANGSINAWIIKAFNSHDISFVLLYLPQNLMVSTSISFLTVQASCSYGFLQLMLHLTVSQKTAILEFLSKRELFLRGMRNRLPV